MKLEGWKISFLVAGLILLALGIFFALAPWSADTILVAIRSTGRSSLFLFSLAFTASSVYHFWKGAFPKWVLRNRRYIGVSFAASHFIHLGLIATISLVFPEPFLKDQSKSQWIFGGLGYVFIALLALTSSDRAQKWMGMKHWKRLHLIGSYDIWLVFLLTYVKHTKADPHFYLPFLVFCAALWPLRLARHLGVGSTKAHS